MNIKEHEAKTGFYIENTMYNFLWNFQDYTGKILEMKNRAENINEFLKWSGIDETEREEIEVHYDEGLKRVKWDEETNEQYEIQCEIDDIF